MKVCKYARGHLVPEQRGRLIGKGPLPKEKLMKALGEVSSHCEMFFIIFSYITISADISNFFKLENIAVGALEKTEDATLLDPLPGDGGGGAESVPCVEGEVNFLENNFFFGKC